MIIYTGYKVEHLKLALNLCSLSSETVTGYVLEQNRIVLFKYPPINQIKDYNTFGLEMSSDAAAEFAFHQVKKMKYSRGCGGDGDMQKGYKLEAGSMHNDISDDPYGGIDYIHGSLCSIEPHWIYFSK